MSLYSDLSRLETIIRNRRDLEIESMKFDLASDSAIFEAELRFTDGSRLIIEEHLNDDLSHSDQRSKYKFHFQDATGEMIFRYDNSPHHPKLTTFPHHKHESEGIKGCDEPTLFDVLLEIAAHSY